MRPLLQHASRSFLANGPVIVSARPSYSFVRVFARAASGAPSICLQCQFRAELSPSSRDSQKWPLKPSKSFVRRFHQTPNEERRPKEEKASSADPKSISDVHEAASADTGATSKKEEAVDTIARVPAEDLPSHKDKQRWDFSKRFNELMEEILPKLAVVTQKVNTYTGTDYSGIEALKREIKEQERLVKSRRAAIEEAKNALDAALSQQSSSQKEVVALLERKHSWSATDLERYMSLIRSEHVNDQAVREAKEAIAAAENALEEARAQLERRERAQYHEEQIWSDTIRRNSTWVTFGLMGLNIFLLLTSLVIFEPWRRRRMVREIREALDAHKAAIEPAAATVAQQSTQTEIIEAEIDKVVDPADLTASEQGSLDSAAIAESSVSASSTGGKPEAIPEEVIEDRESLADTTAMPAVLGATPLTGEDIVPQEAINIEEEVKANAAPETWQEKITFVAQDILSDRVIFMRRVDFTTAILQGAAAGAVIAAAAIMMLRPS